MLFEIDFKIGDFVELTDNVGCIPAGVYKVDNIDPIFTTLTLSNMAAIFSVENCVSHLIVRVDAKEGKKRRTQVADFVQRYYNLMEIESLKDPEILKKAPLTICALNVADKNVRMYAREFN